MEELIKRANDLVERYADYEGYGETQDAELLLEDAMNLIEDLVVYIKK